MADKPLPKSYQKMFHVTTVEELWHKLLSEGDPNYLKTRRFHRLLPSSPRCASCYTPFGGFGGFLARFGLYGSQPSSKNPRYCNACEIFNSKFPGGTEVELTMLFADVRGSTNLAETMSTSDFSRLMNRFYEATINELIQADALIDKIVGDEVIGFFVPGYAGKEHAQRAVEAGKAVLRATGHQDAGGPWVPVGVGIHTGLAWIGTISGANEASSDFTALGDNVNVTARLASKALAGEVLISEATYQAAHINDESLEIRDLELKGKSEKVRARVLHG
jgi:adenylate cyclase